jgi:hypothetical protein
MHSYQDMHGHLPAAAVCGPDGKPLLSWRVSILPFLEQGELYSEFKLDEARDSPHNIKLLPRMPSAYSPPKGKMSKVPPYHTVCHVFVGPRAAFEGCQGLHMPDDFPDGIDSTLLVVEAGKPVPWTKPEDLEFDPHGPLPDLQLLFLDGFRARMVSASSHWVKNDIAEATMRALITRNGGERLRYQFNDGGFHLAP